VGKLKRKRPLGKSRRRWVYNIRMHLGEIGWVGVDWICLVQDRDKWRAHVYAVMNAGVPGKLSSGLTASGPSSC
jgi:hypothetical protein